MTLLVWLRRRVVRVRLTRGLWGCITSPLIRLADALQDVERQRDDALALVEKWREVYKAADGKWRQYEGELIAGREAARVEAYKHAASAVHAEARWQQELKMRGAVAYSGAETAVDRLLVVEKLLLEFAEVAAREEES